MLICSCSVISDRDIRSAVAWMRASDPLCFITPGKVYRALGKQPDCGGCARHFVAAIERQVKTEATELCSNMPATQPQRGTVSDEGQRESYRLP